MDRRDLRILAGEFRGIYKAIDDLQRRHAAAHLTGKVAEIDGDRVRLELLPADGRTGKPFLSPWVQVQEAAGSTGSHFPVAIGDPLRLFSPNGELGPQSIAIRDGYTDDAKNPAENGEFVLAHGNCAIRFKNGAVEIEANAVTLKSGSLKHNERNIGDTHVHGGVERGGANTSTPH
ncbi:phage baseplate protein [Nitratireductor aquimarinus]|uniref:phage baseplate protein n=1 Tax=Nitratireductor aquimarinus TaxID=889300 RepID=UPI001A8D5CAB|nr:phage baseplate protein [Nitratireductor aquimarinus]MBN8243308.1 phage baseplate protein [Nitratireductor aquimarinus]MBY6131209.1 phage baseplate protein [Nitratireductor aquimarinus]MCA1302035.1 phage baseplate protein [Nitratireductor aquimarinus]